MTTPRLTGQRCQCTACGEFFRKSSTFTKHRVGAFGRNIRDPGTRRCLTLAEMEARGWLKNEAGFWITGKRPVIGDVSSVGAAITAETYQSGGVAS